MSGLGFPLGTKAPFTQMYGVLALEVRVEWNFTAVSTQAIAIAARLSAASYLPGGDFACCPLRLVPKMQDQQQDRCSASSLKAM